VRLAAAAHFRAGHDYVIVGRGATEGRPFAKLISDIISTVDYLHREQAQGTNAARGSGRRRLKQDSL
jgi:5,10-methylene-tetrahydrofolate dehydrogenase/methenyl tetrahydrofolate cyclohydrolase